MLVSKYLVLTATTGTAPSARPWQWKEKKKRKVTRTRKAVPLEEVVRGATEEHKYSRLTVLPFSWLCSHLCLANLLSTNTKVTNQCFDRPFAPLRPLDDFWLSLPMSTLKAQVLHSSRVFIPMTLYAQKLLFDHSCSLQPSFCFLIPRTWNFHLLKIFRDKMKFFLCPHGLEMTYQHVPPLSLNAPPKHWGIKKEQLSSREFMGHSKLEQKLLPFEVVHRFTLPGFSSSPSASLLLGGVSRVEFTARRIGMVLSSTF